MSDYLTRLVARAHTSQPAVRPRPWPRFDTWSPPAVDEIAPVATANPVMQRSSSPLPRRALRDDAGAAELEPEKVPGDAPSIPVAREERHDRASPLPASRARPSVAPKDLEARSPLFATQGLATREVAYVEEPRVIDVGILETTPRRERAKPGPTPPVRDNAERAADRRDVQVVEIHETLQDSRPTRRSTPTPGILSRPASGPSRAPAPTPAPEVSIVIHRLEVRTSAVAPKPPSRAANPAPTAPSLNDYLKSRSHG